MSICCFIFARRSGRPAARRIVILTDDDPGCEVVPSCPDVGFSKCLPSALSVRFVAAPCCDGHVRRTVYARTAFGVRAYGVRCTCVRRAVYVRAACGVRGHRNEIGMPFGTYAAQASPFTAEALVDMTHKGLASRPYIAPETPDVPWPAELR